MIKHLLIVLFACGLTGCASLSADERTQLDAMAETNLQGMKKAHPGLEQKLEECKGYMALRARLVKIPFIGWGGGKGVVVDHSTGQRTYVKVSRMDVGGGGGIREFDVLLVVYDEKLLRLSRAGKWAYGLGAEAAAGKASVEGSSDQLQTDKQYEMFTRSGLGASVTWTVHAIYIKPYRD